MASPASPLKVPRMRGARSTRWSSVIGGVIVIIMLIACLGTLPFTLGRIPVGDDPAGGLQPRRFESSNLDQALLPPFWAPQPVEPPGGVPTEEAGSQAEDVSLNRHLLGTDRLGRDLFVRCLTGGGVSLSIGLAAALVAVIIGTLYGTISGYSGGRVDSAMMRIVDILFGLPNILLVVLFAVAVDGVVTRWGADLSSSTRHVVNVVTLLAAIGGVTWLTLARVIRGQVLSLKKQPFMEACRATGVPLRRQFIVHLLPNLIGPIVVYATLTVPSAILAESFLSFLGIGVREPLPSWGSLAADGLNELNVVRSRWWLLLWPCLLLGITLLALNFVGEGLRERFDPKRR